MVIKSHKQTGLRENNSIGVTMNNCIFAAFKINHEKTFLFFIHLRNDFLQYKFG